MYKYDLALAFSATTPQGINNIFSEIKKINDLPVQVCITVQLTTKNDVGRVVNNENLIVNFSSTIGLSKSRNENIKACDSKYIWFLDQDIFIDKKSIIRILELVKHEEVIFLASVKNEKGKFTYGTGKTGEINKNSIIFDKKFTAISIITPLKIKFSEDLGIGSLNHSCEDLEYIYRAVKVYKKRAVMLKDVYIIHFSEARIDFEKKKRYLKGHKAFNKIIKKQKHKFWILTLFLRTLTVNYMQIKNYFLKRLIKSKTKSQ